MDRGADGGSVAGGDLGRVWTVPNALSAGRLCCVPVFLWLLFGPGDTVAAASLLAGLGCTDWVDGFVARRFDQVSTLGKVLDPTADRVLLAAGAVGGLVYGAVPIWVFSVVFARETVVALGAMLLASRRAPRMDVIWLGKAGAFGLMVALPLFLFGHSGLSWHAYAEGAAWVFAIPGMALAWVSLTHYVPQAKAALATGRTAA
ncbi:MAG: CDP-alcohol phosphatidyltransferase family protein [Acidimicrobiales bacterium]